MLAFLAFAAAILFAALAASALVATVAGVEKSVGRAPATLVKPYLPHYFVRQTALGYEVVQVGTGVVVKQTLSEALAQELVKVYTEIDKRGV